MVNLGAFLGGNQGQGGIVPQLQQMQQLQQQKAREAAIMQALHPANAGAPQGMPQGPGSGMPAPGQPPGGMMQGTGAPPPGGVPPQAAGGGAMIPNSTQGRMPPLDQVIAMLSKSGLSADQQYEALKDFGAFSSPFDKMQNQLDMKVQALDAANQRAKDLRDNNLAIAGIRANTSRENTRTRMDVAETARDVGTIEKELGNQRAILSSMLNNGGTKVLETPEYKEAKADYESLRKELQGARSGSSKAKAPSITEETPLAAAGDGPDPAQLSEKEERSLDGGKTWWYLDSSGKPVQSGK